MSRSVTLLVDHRHELGLTAWGDESILVAAPEGATLSADDWVRLAEALAPWARGGKLGTLPESVRVVVERS
jgi:hypothetical protein